MTSERILGIRCRCGGRLKRSVTEVESFGIDFGIKEADVCTECGSEYLSQESMEQIEAKVRKRGLFGLERRGRVGQSGNSPVIRIPKEIVASLKIKRDLPVVIYPSDPRRLVVEVEG